MGSLFRDQEGLTVLDALITLCFIGILIGVVVPKFQQVAKEAQETAVKAELANIRRGIILFKILNDRNPRNLHELMQKDVMLPARIGPDPYSDSFFKRKYLMTNSIDAQGNLVDAFGNFFYYDPVRGEGKSSTKGCETW